MGGLFKWPTPSEQRHSKEIYHITSFEPISESPTSKSFHEPSVKLVWTDVIGTFWRETT